MPTEDIREKIEKAKEVKKHLYRRMLLYNLIIIFTTALSAVITLSSTFSSTPITEYLQIDEYIKPEALGFSLILLSVFFMLNTYDKTKCIENIERLNNILCYDQNIPESESKEQLERERLERELVRLHYLLPTIEQISKYDSDYHKVRMQFRRNLTATIVVGGLSLALIAAIFRFTLPYIVLFVGLFVYPAILIEYFYSLYLRKKYFGNWRKAIYEIVTEEEYESGIRGNLSTKCMFMIIRQTLQRLRYGDYVWNKSALFLSVLALMFSILEFINKTDVFVKFLDFPFNNLKLVATFFLILSTIINVIQLIEDKYRIERTSKVNRYVNNGETSEITMGYQSLIEQGIITDLDIARGKYEYTMKRVEENKIDLLDLADCSNKDNEKRTGQSRINAFVVYVVFESGVYFLWCLNGRVVTFLIFSAIAIVLSRGIKVVYSKFKDWEYKRCFKTSAVVEQNSEVDK